MAKAKMFASLVVMTTGMGGIWEMAVCGCCSMAVRKSGNEEDNNEVATKMITKRAIKMPK